MGESVSIRMPERLNWKTVDAALRDLGFDPHQVRELNITRNTVGQPVLKVEIGANSQTIVRTYDTGRGFNGVRITDGQEDSA